MELAFNRNVETSHLSAEPVFKSILSKYYPYFKAFSLEGCSL